MEQTSFKNQLEFDLPVGFEFNGEPLKQVTLLKSNGIAEEIFLKKLSEKPYTWIGNVLSTAIGYLGNTPVGQAVREEYSKTKSVLIPKIIKLMPLADSNTSLVEIHRRVWKEIIPNQAVMCKFCGVDLLAEINLGRICMSENNLAKLKEADKIEFIICDLVDGFTLDPLLAKLDKEQLNHLKGVLFNRLTFRVPTLGDAIKNEAHIADNLLFWRRMAQDCLNSIERIEDSKPVAEFPEEFFGSLGLELYKNYLSPEDLSKVRYSMREEVPTMPFSYRDTCPCDMQKDIPFTMEASGFFSE